MPSSEASPLSRSWGRQNRGKKHSSSVLVQTQKMCVLLNCASNFLLFTFQHKKHWKRIFGPAFGVHSTQTLVKIYNMLLRNYLRETTTSIKTHFLFQIFRFKSDDSFLLQYKQDQIRVQKVFMLCNFVTCKVLLNWPHFILKLYQIQTTDNNLLFFLSN